MEEDSEAQQMLRTSERAPLLASKGSTSAKNGGWQLNFINNGGTVHTLRVRTEDGTPIQIAPTEQLRSGEKGYLVVGENQLISDIVIVRLAYSDLDGEHYKRYQCIRKGNVLKDLGYVENFDEM